MNSLIGGTLLLLVGMLIGSSVIVVQNVTRLEAAPANVPDVECYPWADAEGWTVTRCYDYNNNEACLIASSGFVACRMGDE